VDTSLLLLLLKMPLLLSLKEIHRRYQLHIWGRRQRL
jgi:hypothetical protein